MKNKLTTIIAILIASILMVSCSSTNKATVQNKLANTSWKLNSKFSRKPIIIGSGYVKDNGKVSIINVCEFDNVFTFDGKNKVTLNEGVLNCSKFEQHQTGTYEIFTGSGIPKIVMTFPSNSFLGSKNIITWKGIRFKKDKINVEVASRNNGNEDLESVVFKKL